MGAPVVLAESETSDHIPPPRPGPFDTGSPPEGRPTTPFTTVRLYPTASTSADHGGPAGGGINAV